MTTVGQILDQKGSQVWSLPPDAIVYDALRLLAERDIGVLLVIQGDRLVGILSERDYARKVILKGKSSMKTSVQEIMTERVFVVEPQRSMEEAMALMPEKRLRHLPVVEGEQVVGLVSIGDLVKAKIADLRFVIEQLERYIAGA
jgi:CBS domain-containing protein